MQYPIIKPLIIIISLFLLTQSCKDEELDICVDNSLMVSADVSSSNITANSSGGTAPYTFSWSNNDTTQMISGLANGSYTVTVTDGNGCTISASAIITSIQGCVGSSLVVTTEVSGTTITANATGGTNPYVYNWSNGESTKMITGLAEGVYSVTVIDDDGCSTTTNETIVSQNACIVDLLTKFSGTGLNFSININGDNVVFLTQGLPNHPSPYYDLNDPLFEAYNGMNIDFVLNRNTISQQNIVFTIPLCPEEATQKQSTSLGPIGISINGIPFFNQFAGPNQPLTNEINSFDQWFGHPQASGMYHYHLEPTYLTQQNGTDAFLGLLADGFPVYGSVEGGAILVSSDLDNYHGHFGVTTDFPNGIYHYHFTADAPYLNGDGFYGTPGDIQ